MTRTTPRGVLLEALRSMMRREQLEKLCSCDLLVIPNQQKQISSITSFAARGLNSERKCGHVYASPMLPLLWLMDDYAHLENGLDESLWKKSDGLSVQSRNNEDCRRKKSPVGQLYQYRCKSSDINFTLLGQTLTTNH